MSAMMTATTMAAEINALVATGDMADYCTEAQLARALVAERERVGLPVDDDLTALGCGWWRMEGDGVTLYQDTEWEGRWVTVEATGTGGWEAYVVRASDGRRDFANCYESAHDSAREIVEDWAGWSRG